MGFCAKCRGCCWLSVSDLKRFLNRCSIRVDGERRQAGICVRSKRRICFCLNSFSPSYYNDYFLFSMKIACLPDKDRPLYGRGCGGGILRHSLQYIFTSARFHIVNITIVVQVFNFRWKPPIHQKRISAHRLIAIPLTINSSSRKGGKIRANSRSGSTSNRRISVVLIMTNKPKRFSSSLMDVFDIVW